RKRQAYELPDGAHLLIGSIRTNFFCDKDGYFADVENHCQIFHVCHTSFEEGKEPRTRQWSFICGNQTIFDQLTQTCAFPEDAVLCERAPEFFYLNERIGDPNALFLTDQDIVRAEAAKADRPFQPPPPPPRIPPPRRPGFQG
ncbi:uncharacterized protein LOC111617518, partial [Centruroides sculpturatus]